MTPQEISDYRVKWIATEDFSDVSIYSDDFVSATQWCHEELKPGSWKAIKHSGQHECRVLFENEKDANIFSSFFGT